MAYLKHNGNGGNGGRKKREPKQQQARPTSVDYKAEYVEESDRNSRCVEEAIDGLCRVISAWVTQERDGDNASGLYSNPHAYPVRIELTDVPDLTVTLLLEGGDAINSIADSLKRIADAISEKKAG